MRNTQTIAAYSFVMNTWFYWNAETEQFDLMQLKPGKLIKVPTSPIRFRHRRSHCYDKEGTWFQPISERRFIKP